MNRLTERELTISAVEELRGAVEALAMLKGDYFDTDPETEEGRTEILLEWRRSQIRLTAIANGLHRVADDLCILYDVEPKPEWYTRYLLTLADAIREQEHDRREVKA